MKRVTFFGIEYSAEGIHPDSKKVQGIVDMTPLTDKQQLQSFLGMVNYMGRGVSFLTSHITQPLRVMLKKDAFHWDQQVNQSFQQIKALITKENESLTYYDRTLPVTVQADASLRGLAACLIQKHNGKDQPIAFSSKNRMDVETRHANIENCSQSSLPAITSVCIYWEGVSQHRAVTSHWR